MSEISEWSTVEAENTHIDELTLSGESGQYINKIMCAVKAKSDEVDGKLAKVQGAYVFKGVKADMTALEAVTEPAVGDVYSVTALGGENYAWDGTAWDSLGTSDANVVHKTGTETISGSKTFTSSLICTDGVIKASSEANNNYLSLVGGKGGAATNGAKVTVYGAAHSTSPGFFIVQAGDADAYVQMQGKPDGTLSWNGNAIQTTSDARLKTILDNVPDDVLDAWGDVAWGQFKFLSAVDRKGDNARLHLGLIAQNVKNTFEVHGLDACRYGILCHEEHESTDSEPANDLWMVRYEEALAMECAFQRRRADRMEARINALEAIAYGEQQ